MNAGAEVYGVVSFSFFVLFVDFLNALACFLYFLFFSRVVRPVPALFYVFLFYLLCFNFFPRELYALRLHFSGVHHYYFPFPCA